MYNLKPCPFCGSKPETIVDYDVGGGEFVISAYVKCPNCLVYKRNTSNMKNASFREFLILFDKTELNWNERYTPGGEV